MQRWDFFEESTVRHFATICASVKFVKHWILSHFSEAGDFSYVGSAMCPETHRKYWQRKTCWQRSWEKSPELDQGPGWRDYMFDLAYSPLGVKPAELSEIAANCEVFRVLIELMTPRPTPEEDRVRNWMNELFSNKSLMLMHCIWLQDREI